MGLDIMVIPTVDQKDPDDPVPPPRRVKPLMILQLSDEMVEEIGGVGEAVGAVCSSLSFAIKTGGGTGDIPVFVPKPDETPPVSGLTQEELDELLEKEDADVEGS